MGPEAGGWLLAGVGATLAGAAALPLVPSAGPRAGALSRWLCALAGLGLVALGVLASLGPGAIEARLGSVLGFPLVSLSYDALSFPFLVALGIVTAASSIHSLGYDGRSAHPPGTWSRVSFPIFVASMALVFGADDAFALMLAWEAMALSSAVLVVGSRPDEESARTGYLYLAFTHVASVALVVAFGLLSMQAGSTDIASLAQAAGSLPGLMRDGLFLLLLIGFATKAGAIPLHIWLPRAHPVAPAPVSALMSGVMIKAGVYGLVRFGLEMMGAGPAWWGVLVVAIGAISAVLGVLYALAQHDAKRLLAFHSIENVGIILLGVGVAMVAAGAGLGGLAAMSLGAALFHSLNHAIFKSGLFLATGAVQSATGTRHLDRLGGLARLMPYTAIAFVVSAAAISGLPPLNGFASEWLTFQGLIAAGADSRLDAVVRITVLLAVGALALTTALAAACFVKASGMAFLGLPRSPEAARAGEVGPSMWLPAVSLAGLCVALGVAAAPVAGWLLDIASRTVSAAVPASAAVGPVSVGGELPTFAAGALEGAAGGAFQAAGLGLLVVALALGLRHLAGRSRVPRRSATWTCGLEPEAAFEYTATSYSKLIRLFFARVLRTEREVRVEHHPGTPLPSTVRYRYRVPQPLDERVYGPLLGLGVSTSQLVRRLQSGNLQAYLGYAVAALLVLLWLAR